MNRTITMLCPKCQTERQFNVTVEEMIDGNYNAITQKKLFVGASAYCPECHVEMYQADKLLVPALVRLNKEGIITSFHCDKYHDGLKLDVNNEKEHGIKIDGKIFYRGPYIVMINLSPDDIFFLGQASALYNKKETDWRIHTEYDTAVGLSSEIHKILKKKEICRTELSICSSKYDQSNAKELNGVMNSFIMDWIDILHNHSIHHEIPEQFYYHMSNRCFNQFFRDEDTK